MESKELFNIDSLDLIFNRMLETITNSKDDIFVISEQSRLSFEQIQTDLLIIREQLLEVFSNGEKLETETKEAKKKLVVVSQDFQRYTEKQVKEVYENANELQLQLTLNRATEKQLREKRDDLERRLRALLETIERADHLANQVNTVMDFLNSDLKQIGPALEQAKMKQDFSIKILNAQEEERKRLSREIHDGPAQMMANVLVRSSLIERTLRQSGLDEAIIEINSLRENVRRTLSEVRRIIYNLRPMALDDLGIVPTLKKYLSTLEEYHPDVEIQFISLNNEQEITSDYEIAIFRLVQESVNNALKHAKATLISTKMEWRRDRVFILIQDNGQGFDVDEVKAQSFGLIGMRERVELMKGEYQIYSSIGKGTVIQFNIPL